MSSRSPRPARSAGLALAAAAGAIALAATPAVASAATAPAGTQALPVQGQADRGAATAATRAFSLVLASRDQAGLDAYVADPQHAALTPQQFADRFGPTAAARSAVDAWAAANGLQASGGATSSVVRLSGTTQAVGAALGTSFRRFTAAGRDYTGPASAAKLPASVAAVTRSVVGLSSAGQLVRPTTTKVTPSASKLNIPASYGPKELADLYGAGSSSQGAGQSVAVIAQGDVSGPRKDLGTFEDTYGLPHVPWVQTDVGTPSTDTAGADEWSLDTQYSTGLAPAVDSLQVYVGPTLSNDDILATIDRWVTDRKTTQASFSAGECESLAALTGFTTALDAVLEQAAAQGQTLFTSSGDTGSQCPLPLVAANGVPVGQPGVNYPAASPYAIGVGGTTVLGDGPTELGWYGSGGGLSLTEDVPAWQKGVGGSFVGLRRGVPDVALDADPTSGYEVVVGGTVETIGGTSASAPAWQGIWTRAQATRGPLGFAGPAIYSAPASAFSDVLVGTNVLFPNTPGYDYVTGRGTPRIAAFAAGQ